MACARRYFRSHTLRPALARPCGRSTTGDTVRGHTDHEDHDARLSLGAPVGWRRGGLWRWLGEVRRERRAEPAAARAEPLRAGRADAARRQGQRRCPRLRGRLPRQGRHRDLQEEGLPRRAARRDRRRGHQGARQDPLFGSGNANLDPADDAILDKVAEILKNGKDIEPVEVEGHADHKGDPKVNVTLTDNRAKAVVAALVKRGVDKSRLVSRGSASIAPSSRATPRPPTRRTAASSSRS
ncbi:MAG: OmpA family protein [Myxococcales bacterium]|nr:OmpA family protein [Myxococcales bacterium]